MKIRKIARHNIDIGIFPTCYLCGSPITRQKDLTIDHIVSKHTMKELGIKNIPNNCAIACKKCNQAKGDLTLAEYLNMKRRER